MTHEQLHFMYNTFGEQMITSFIAGTVRLGECLSNFSMHQYHRALYIRMADSNKKLISSNLFIYMNVLTTKVKKHVTVLYVV